MTHTQHTQHTPHTNTYTNTHQHTPTHTNTPRKPHTLLAHVHATYTRALHTMLVLLSRTGIKPHSFVCSMLQTFLKSLSMPPVDLDAPVQRNIWMDHNKKVVAFLAAAIGNSVQELEKEKTTIISLGFSPGTQHESSMVREIHERERCQEV